MSTPDLLAALTPVVEAFDRLGIGYQIGGSVASSAHGVARATLDVDLVARLTTQQIAPLVRLLEKDYYIDADMIEEAIRRHSCFNLIHNATMLKVDVFVLKARDYDQQAFSRGTADTLEEAAGGRPFVIASAEDVVLNKLEWYRIGGEVSERQWADVIGVLRVQEDLLDREYLQRWACRLQLDDLLERAWDDALEP